MSSEQNHVRTKVGPSSPPGNLPLGLSSGGGKGNPAACPGASSPESQRSQSSLSDGGTSSPSDVDMLEVCLSQDSPNDQPTLTDTITNDTFKLSSPQFTVPSEMELKTNQSVVSSSVNNTSVDNLNGNISLGTGDLEGSPNDSRGNQEVLGTRSTATSPDSTESESLHGSTTVSSENSCSLSSGEMVMRSNSFCLEEDQPLTISLLDDTSSSPALPAEVSLLSAPLPEVYKGLPEGLSTEGEKSMGPQHCWGMTFIQSDVHNLPPEDDHLVESTSPLDVPCEAEGGHLRTFLCEPATAATDGVSPAAAPSSKTSSDAELWPYFTGGSTSGEGQTFILPANEDLDSSGHAQTSTPVQNVGNRAVSFPSITESPSTTNTDSPTPCPAKEQRAAVTPKQRLVARLTPSTGRISKIPPEIKRFPKPDFSSIKPKIMTRPAKQMSMTSSALSKATPRKPAQGNMLRKQSQGTNSTPTKRLHTGAVNSLLPKPSTEVDSQSSKSLTVLGENPEAPYLGMTFIQSEDQDLSPAVEDGEPKASVCESIPSASEHAPTCNPGSLETEHVACSSGEASSHPCASNQTVCILSPSEPNSSKDQDKPTLASANERTEVVPNHNRKRTKGPSNQEKPPISTPRSRCWSESSSSSRLIREGKASTCSSSSFTTPKVFNLPNPAKVSLQNRPTQNRKPKQSESSKTTPDRTSLPEAPSKSSMTTESGPGPGPEAGGAVREGTKSRFGVRPFPIRARGGPASQTPVASPSQRPLPPAPRQRQGAWGRDGSCTPGGMGSPRTKHIINTTAPTISCAGSHRARPTEGPSAGASSTKGGSRHPVTGSRPTQTPGRGLAMGQSSTPASRLPHKPQAQGPPRSTPSKASAPSEHSVSTGSTQVSGGPSQSSTGRPGSFRSKALRARHLTHPVRNTGPASATGCRTTASTNQTGPRPGTSPLVRTGSYRMVRPNAALPVDKSRPKASQRNQTPTQPTAAAPPPPTQSRGHPGLVPTTGRPGGTEESYQAQCERQRQTVQQLRGLLVSSNCRFEAVAVVLQQALAERDEAMKQRKELSLEMMTLRGELVSSSHVCDRLEQEKEEARATMEEVLLKVQEQHGSELAQLEERLQTFYQAEWDKVHLTYQQEADKCKALMEQQMGELRANHEILRLELEKRHSEQLQCVKQQYEDSLEEVRKAHKEELQALERTLKEAEANLFGQIQELTAENGSLSQRLKAEEDRRRELAEKNQKDSHTLYLEQELESLKVVLDIKNKQLHQQDKKLMQMDKLMEKSVKINECLQKVQQENEELRARTDRHSALSRQLSTEQAVLQESLQKESKVNKRLSMENEELLWKLHNGDLSSPRKMSPTSPAHSLSLQSPRGSAVFSSPPVSPR